MTTDDIRSSSPTTTTVGPGPAMGPGLPLGIYTNHFGKGCRKNSRGSYSGECNFLDPGLDQVWQFIYSFFFFFAKFDLPKVDSFFPSKKVWQKYFFAKFDLLVFPFLLDKGIIT